MKSKILKVLEDNMQCLSVWSVKGCLKSQKSYGVKKNTKKFSYIKYLTKDLLKLKYKLQTGKYVSNSCNWQ